ncbi:MAG TPA: hypothetical protein VG497_30865 [Kribbella sp.]|nr:hypothetical protein [Kribbella sp.]
MGRRRTFSLVLLALTLVLLAVGRFVEFDDTSGFGSTDWNLPLGILAAAAAVAALVIAWPEPKARLWLGIALGVLTVLVIWQDAVDDGFRFVWNQSEGELREFELGLALLVVVLLTTAGAALGGGRWLLRVAAYVVGVAVVSVVVALVAAAYYEAHECAGQDEGCLAPLGGVVWGAGAVVACLVAIAVIELILWRRRRPKRAEVRG